MCVAFMFTIGAQPMSRLIQAAEVARTLGIKTATLSKWRRQGRGPRGWLRLSSTLVVYPQAELDQFLQSCESDPAIETSPVGKDGAVQFRR